MNNNFDLKNLKEIIELIKSDKLDQALLKFKNHLNLVVTVGRYKRETWNYEWRENVYEFGQSFIRKDPIDFLNAIKAFKKGKTKDESEVLDFYYSEIEANTLPEDLSVKYFENLVKEYPYNPEFKHTLAHYYAQSDLKKAIDQYRFAFKSDRGNSIFEKSLFNKEILYINQLLKQAKYENARERINYLLKEGLFAETILYHNELINIKNRVNDYIDLNEKIVQAGKDMQEIAKEAVNKNQFKVIEILSIFTAIVTFIFSTVSIGKNFSLNDALIFNISLGVTLVMFIDVTHMFFSFKKISSFYDYRVLLLIALLFFQILIIIEF